MYSKSGCKTCKIRKIKCDEGYPVCQRCLSTGRKCDGYKGVPPHGLHHPIPAAMRAAIFASMSLQERQNLQWFELRTMRKLPATCQTEFWSKLILQASHSQPAVLYASMALGALHREIILGAPNSEDASQLCNAYRPELHSSLPAICNYMKALQHLRAHTSTVEQTRKTNADAVSLQALLIACILFVSLESSPVDNWIKEAFLRMELQLTLWNLSANQRSTGFYADKHATYRCTLPRSRHFATLKDAWNTLAQIIIKSVHLTRVCYDSKLENTFSQKRNIFFDAQQSILRTLRQWRAKFDLMLKQEAPQDHGPSRTDTKIGLIIPVYYEMATIIAELSFCAGNEMAFDTQLHRFTSMLRLLQDLYQVDQTKPDLRHFIMDLGCLAPLYYIATKCRDHVVRWQGVKMLESVFHREGIWDAPVTAAVARKVVEEEEYVFIVENISTVKIEMGVAGAFSFPPLPSYDLQPQPDLFSCLLFRTIDTLDLFPQYRWHSPEEITRRNHASRYEVARDVIIQQLMQVATSAVLQLADPPEHIGKDDYEVAVWATRVRLLQRAIPGLLRFAGVDAKALSNNIPPSFPLLASIVADGYYPFLKSDAELPCFAGWEMAVAKFIYHFLVPALQFFAAVLILDTWQYFLHRLMHMNRWLYTTFHSRHHRLYVPYAYGALYNHPFEGFLLDILGAGTGFKATSMTSLQSTCFFTFSTMKTIDDHCGYAFPWDPFQLITNNNAVYHDIHHQPWGIKTNFSQPFFIFWDQIFGTKYDGPRVNRVSNNQREKKAVAT
ncbi:hypothetical protein NLG97_g2386 [Lecanicillium saksenae]|uniref:Uncharacterized protein n=1 Tax=Lecanicillium saksenae TaxID=468837 RepID=A0ACC1R2B4_9HYPO|nr:hypothetical protein NLG97_g2386 [Lecanicillium saksenae]